MRKIPLLAPFTYFFLIFQMFFRPFSLIIHRVSSLLPSRGDRARFGWKPSETIDSLPPPPRKNPLYALNVDLSFDVLFLGLMQKIQRRVFNMHNYFLRKIYSEVLI